MVLLKEDFGFYFAKIKSFFFFPFYYYSDACVSPDRLFQPFHYMLQIIKIPFAHYKVGIRMNMKAPINIMNAMKTLKRTSFFTISSIFLPAV